MQIKIAIAEDNRFALEGIIKRLSKYPEIKIKYTAANGKELISKIQENHNIDLILMDLEMPIMNGIDSTKIIKNKYPHIKILILTTFDDDKHLFDSILAGASGYL